MSWTERAQGFLEAVRLADGSWGYRQGGSAFTEPTALATLARSAHGDSSPRSLEWLAGAQRGEGSLTMAPDWDQPPWPTSLAILAWRSADSHAPETQRAVEFLLGFRGKHWSADPAVGHDTSLVGWPWVAATHSWVEPTGYALCALRRTGRGDHDRARSGRDMLLDRVVEGGGWNYGNTTVLGSMLHAYPGPTGVALLATLPDLGQEPRIATSVEWLLQRVQGARSPLSLSWSLLGLAAAGQTPREAPGWLEASFARMEQRELRVADVSLLLLAARAEQAVTLLGGRA